MNSLVESVEVLKDGGTNEEVSTGLIVCDESFEKIETGFGWSIVERDTVHSIGCLRDIVIGKAMGDCKKSDRG